MNGFTWMISVNNQLLVVNMLASLYSNNPLLLYCKHSLGHSIEGLDSKTNMEWPGTLS